MRQSTYLQEYSLNPSQLNDALNDRLVYRFLTWYSFLIFFTWISCKRSSTIFRFEKLRIALFSKQRYFEWDATMLYYEFQYSKQISKKSILGSRQHYCFDFRHSIHFRTHILKISTIIAKCRLDTSTAKSEDYKSDFSRADFHHMQNVSLAQVLLFTFHLITVIICMWS